MELKIPAEINYECTGCGRCCSGWSVPMTGADYERISAVDWGKLNPQLKDKKLFRELKPHERINTPYTHAINPEANGQCPFLKDNLCFIHSQFEAKFKPAICQLFPYCFNETPDGVYATVSFISWGAVVNAGKALSEQKEYLLSKYNEFQKLFPDHHPNWTGIKLSANLPLNWQQYLDVEKTILPLIQDKNKSLESRFLEGSIYLNSLLVRKNADSKRQDNEIDGLNSWDKILLATLYRIYFPDKNKRAKGYGQLNLSLGSFINTIPYVRKIEKLLIKGAEIAWPQDDLIINDLIYRFFYSRLFAKLYFGAGFGQLSVIAGFNHLAVLLVLLRMRIAAVVATRGDGDSAIKQEDVIAVIRQLEKNLGELKISPYGAAMLELLLISQQRIARLINFIASTS